MVFDEFVQFFAIFYEVILIQTNVFLKLFADLCFLGLDRSHFFELADGGQVLLAVKHRILVRAVNLPSWLLRHGLVGAVLRVRFASGYWGGNQALLASMDGTQFEQASRIRFSEGAQLAASS